MVSPEYFAFTLVFLFLSKEALFPLPCWKATKLVEDVNARSELWAMKN
jgi:hypothetical protein